MYYNTSGADNAAYGYTSLYSNTTGAKNVAVGKAAMYKNQIGGNNVTIGESALFNSEGHGNVACGSSALYSTSTAYGANTAIGDHALYSANSSFNTAAGSYVMYANTTGYHNTAMGYGTLGDNTTGVFNTAIGSLAMDRNTTGHYNTGIGGYALFNTTASQYNTAVGYFAGNTYDNGWNNVFVGANTDVNGVDYYNVVAIGQGTICTDVNQARIGNSATVSIGGYANWSNISDVRVKKNIKQNVPGLAFINKLQPITYNLNLEAAEQIIQPPTAKNKDGKVIQPTQQELNAKKAKEKVVYTGFAAQDVEKAAKELNYDFSGVDAAKNEKDLYGLRYAEFVVPLVKAVQELSKMNEEKDVKIDGLQKQIDELKAMISGNTKTNITLSNASLEQNIPNPFNNTTTIGYVLPQRLANAQIVITDNNGKMMKQINISGSGKGTVNVDAGKLSSGAYNYSLYIDGKFITSKQMVLTK